MAVPGGNLHVPVDDMDLMEEEEEEEEEEKEVEAKQPVYPEQLPFAYEQAQEEEISDEDFEELLGYIDDYRFPVDASLDNLQKHCNLLRQLLAVSQETPTAVFESSLRILRKQHISTARYRSWIEYLTTMDRACAQRSDLTFEQVQDIQQHVRHAFVIVEAAYNSVILNEKRVTLHDPDLSGVHVAAPSIEHLSSITEPQATEEKKIPAKMRAVDRFYDILFASNLRRRGNSVYAPKYVKINQADGSEKYVYAFFYEKVNTIEEWMRRVHGGIRSPSGADMYQLMCTVPGHYKTVAAELEAHHDNRFPDLEEDPHLYLFRTGAFHSMTQDYYPYDEETAQRFGLRTAAQALDPSKIGHVFIDEEFRYELIQQQRWHHPDTGARLPRPIDEFIQVDSFEKIMQDQKWNRDTIKHCEILMGRTCYPLNTFDKWQVLPFFNGRAGCGKSALLKGHMSLFKYMDIGGMGNKARNGFPLQALYKKRMFIAFDVDEQFNYDQATWNSMISGEWVKVDIAFDGEGTTVEWSAPGLMAGNRMLPFIDRGGSASRRLILFLFLYKPPGTDQDLCTRMMKDRDLWLWKIIHLYRQHAAYIQRTAGVDYEATLPQYFHRNRRELRAKTNSLVGFLDDTSFVLLGDVTQGYHCRWQDFKDRYASYCEEQSIPAKNLTKSTYEMPFIDSSIELRKGQNPYQYDEAYLTGVFLVDPQNPAARPAPIQ